jgi:hypothetical protein
MLGDEIGWGPVDVGNLSRTVRSQQELATICILPETVHVKRTYTCLAIETSSKEMDETPVSFLAIFKFYPDLEELTISRMTLGVSPLGFLRIEELTSALAQNKTLKTLTFLNCGVDEKGATDLANSLRQNTTLETLKLEINQIGDLGAQKLAEALNTNTTLQHLSLFGDKQITDVGTGCLGAAAFSSSTLKSLDFAGIKTEKTPSQQAQFAAVLGKKGITVKFN